MRLAEAERCGRVSWLIPEKCLQSGAEGMDKKFEGGNSLRC